MADDRLNNLLTYTIFHIGVYVSLFTALIGAGIFGALDLPILRFAVGCFFAAGVAGAVVGSNISEHVTFKSYSDAKLGPWGMPLLSYWWWTVIEHFAFWAGVVPIVVGFIFWGPGAFKAPRGSEAEAACVGAAPKIQIPTPRMSKRAEDDPSNSPAGRP